jgi:major vault protein
MILGAKEEGKREGWLFEENGMHIYEVEILDIKILDQAIQKLLFQDKHNEIRKNVDLLNQKKELEFTHETELIKQQIAKYKAESATVELELERNLIAQNLEVEMTKLQSQLQLEKERYESQLLEREKAAEMNRLQLVAEKETEALQAEIAQRKLDQRMLEVKAEVDAVVQKAAAISPDLIAALQAYGDKALAEKMAETMAPLSIIGGKSVVDVFANLVKGTQLEKVLQFTKKQMETEELDEGVE